MTAGYRFRALLYLAGGDMDIFVFFFLVMVDMGLALRTVLACRPATQSHQGSRSTLQVPGAPERGGLQWPEQQRGNYNFAGLFFDLVGPMCRYTSC